MCGNLQRRKKSVHFAKVLKCKIYIKQNSQHALEQILLQECPSQVFDINIPPLQHLEILSRSTELLYTGTMIGSNNDGGLT